MNDIIAKDSNIFGNEGLKPEVVENKGTNKEKITSELAALNKDIAKRMSENKDYHKKMAANIFMSGNLFILHWYFNSEYSYIVSKLVPDTCKYLGFTFGALFLFNLGAKKYNDTKLTGARIAMTKKQKELEQLDSKEDVLVKKK